MIMIKSHTVDPSVQLLNLCSSFYLNFPINCNIKYSDYISGIQSWSYEPE